MKKQIVVKISTNAKDLRIKHFKCMAFVPANEFKQAKESLFFLAAFLNLRYNQMLDFKASDIKKMTAAALNALSKLDLVTDLPKELTLAGTTYYLVDPKSIGIGWHIDFNNCSIEKDPVRLACLFYVQKDYNYSDVDANGNIVYPIDSRHKIFEEHFPLNIFIKASGFFLSRSLHSIRKSMVLENQKTKTKISLIGKILNPLNGRQRLRPS